MAADPDTTPHGGLNPIDLLIAFEEATDVPIRPEYIEGTVSVPPPPNYKHNKGAMDLIFQLSSAGVEFVGQGCGFVHEPDGVEVRTLVIPDFYVLRREPSELDEAFCKVHKGWYPISLVDLAGEVTSTNHEMDTGPKYRSYAAAGVPVYVVVHRQRKLVYAHSDPEPAAQRYRSTTEVVLGDKVKLPEPYPPLDTSVFTD